MSTSKHIDRICVIVLICTLLLTVLFMNGEALGLEKITDQDAERNSDSVYFTANDLDGDWDADSPTATIALNGDSAKVRGNGAYAYNGGVVITGGGTYVLSGTLEDGSITVDAYKSSKVWLLLDGVDVSCSDDAALRVNQADKVFLTLAQGSENSFSSGQTYSSESLEDGTDGTIFAHDDLTINGSGSLRVTAAYKHGVAANDDLVITGGNITVQAPADGIRANDSMRICGADITVNAGDDGIVAAKEEEGQGWLYLESGRLSIVSADDGVHTAGDITIDGGDITIRAGDDGIHSDTNIVINDCAMVIEECYEGIEAITITMNGGDITIYPEDDGLNANGNSGGLGMGGGMDNMGGRGGFGGQDSDGSGAEMPDGGMPGMGEMPEGSMPDFGDFDGSRPEMGDLPQMPDGGMPEGSMPEMGGGFGGQGGGPGGRGGGPGGFGGPSGSMPEGFMPETGEEREVDQQPGSDPQQADQTGGETQDTWIRINGGTLTILNANGRDADGLDSNGSIYITGGDIRVSLVNSGSNSAIDYGRENGGVCEISGGTVMACGSYSMAEAFDSSSTQCAILYNFSAGAQAGAILSLEDSSGNVLLSWKVPYSFSSANISCPEMQLGESYRVVIGDRMEEITLEEVSTSYGDAASSMFGGNMNFGGMQDRGDFGGRGGGKR